MITLESYVSSSLSNSTIYKEKPFYLAFALCFLLQLSLLLFVRIRSKWIQTIDYKGYCQISVYILHIFLTVCCFMCSYWVVDMDQQMSRLYHDNNSAATNDSPYHSFLNHGPNISLVRCFAVLWFLGWLALFLRKEIEGIR